jgi:siderophore synthetase component
VNVASPGGPTARRLLAALVRDGLAEGVRDGAALRVTGPRGSVTTAFTGPDPSFPHPAELPECGGDPLALLDAVGVAGDIASWGGGAEPPRNAPPRAGEPPPASDPTAGLRAELASAVAMMDAAPRRDAPLLEGPALAWEQAIVEGHATHPCHKSRVGMTVEEARRWAAEHRGGPELVYVRGAPIRAHGPFAALVQSEGVPVHPGQLPALRLRFPELEVLPERRRAAAQASLRTVCPEGLPVHLKLALAVQTTSALRTISPQSVHNGPRLSALFAALAPPALHVVEELASAGAVHPDPDVAKHLACIVRADPERAFPGDRFVVCAALVERDASGVPLARGRIASEADFERYVALLLDAVLPMMRDHGVALEAHGQNTLARYREGALVGFAVRDFGGVRLHRPTLRASGHDVALAPDSAPDAAELETVWAKLHHCVVQHHLGELIRALDLGATGWSTVRRHVDRHLLGAPSHAFWTARAVPHKCLLRMRLTGRYRDYLYRPAPNPLFDV